MWAIGLEQLLLRFELNQIYQLMATYGSADNVHIANRGSGVVSGQPVSYGIAQPQNYTTTNYTSFNTGEINPAYHTSYSGYTGTAADHAHTNAPPKITFGQSNTQGSFNNNYRVSAPPPVTTTTSNVNVVPQTRVVEEVRPVQSSVVNTTYQPPAQPITTTTHTYQQPVAQPVATTHTYQQPVAAPPQPLQTTYHHQPVRTEAKEDNFLCSRCCWIIAAIIGLILLTLALLWGLGVFGGEGKPSGKAPHWGTDANVAAPAVQAPVVQAPVVQAPTVTAPTVAAPAVQAPAVQAPVVQRPTVVHPDVQVQPSYVEPTVHHPVASAPVVSQPVVSQPAVAVQPSYVEPTVHHPVVTGPTVAASQPTVNAQPATVDYQPSTVSPSVQPAVNPNYNAQPVAYNAQPVAYNAQSVAPSNSNNAYHQSALTHEQDS